MEGDSDLADLFEKYNKSTDKRTSSDEGVSDNNMSASGSTYNTARTDASRDNGALVHLSVDNGNSNEASGENEDEPNEPKPLSDKEAEARFMTWYEEICNERFAMLETEENNKNKVEELEKAEKGYRKRIKELDEGSLAMVQAFEQAQSETKVLRQKYEATDDNDLGYHEPYNDVVKHRDKLVKAEKKYKQKIANLEEEVSTLTNKLDSLEILPQQRNVSKQKRSTDKKAIRKANKLVVITGAEYMAELEKENLVLKGKLEKLEREMVNGEVSKSEITKTQYKSVQTTFSIKREVPVQRDKEKYVSRSINKKHTPPFLPKIPTASSGSFDDRSTSVTSLHRTTQTPGLMYGLSYRELYYMKEFKRTDSQYSQSISKYIV